MGLDSDIAVRWLIDTANADAQVQSLLGGQKLFRGSNVPRATAPPYVAVSMTGTQPPARYVFDGPSTQVSTVARIQTTIIDKENASYYALEKITQVANRLIALLDGQNYQTVTGGLIYSCIMQQDRNRDELVGDIQYRYIDIDWYVDAKAD